jgi:hypothetical protein
MSAAVAGAVASAASAMAVGTMAVRIMGVSPGKAVIPVVTRKIEPAEGL